MLPIAVAPLAPALPPPIFVTSTVPAPEELMVIVVNGCVAPIAPCSWTLPLPLSITRASLSVFVPSIVPSINIFPPPLPPSSVLIVVVPSVLRTIFPPSKVRLLFVVVIVGDAPVNRIELLPAAASKIVTPSVL